MSLSGAPTGRPEVLELVAVPSRAPVARSGVHRFALAAALALSDVVALAIAVLWLGPAGWLSAGYPLAVLALLRAAGLQRPRICLRSFDQAPRVTVAVAAPLLVWWLAAGTDGLAQLGMSTWALVVALRGGTCAAIRGTHRRGRLVDMTLVVGTDPVAVRIAELLREHPELGLRPRGFLGRNAPGRPGGLPLLGSPDELAEVVARHGIGRVVVCFPAGGDTELVPLLRSVPVDAYVVPRLHELGVTGPAGSHDDICGVPVLPLRRTVRRLAGKRLMDLGLAGVLIVAVAPVLIPLATIVRLRHGRSPFFRQTRVTRSGRTFTILKLRTIRDDSDADTRWVVPLAGCSRFDRWLRDSHLDELPQLLNVVRGDMSLVGPRPERPYFTGRFSAEIPHYGDRHRMPAGMTGWAQVHGLHGDSSIRDRVRFDNYYIEHWSPWLDVTILVRTVAGLLRFAAHRGGRP